MTGAQFEVGSYIRTTDESRMIGRIVEDFGDLAGAQIVVDANSIARSRRWAVELNDGRMVFLDDHEMEAVG